MTNEEQDALNIFDENETVKACNRLGIHIWIE